MQPELLQDDLGGHIFVPHSVQPEYSPMALQSLMHT